MLIINFNGQLIYICTLCNNTLIMLVYLMSIIITSANVHQVMVASFSRYHSNANQLAQQQQQIRHLHNHHHRSLNTPSSIDIKDKILELQCQAKCEDDFSNRLKKNINNGRSNSNNNNNNNNNINNNGNNGSGGIMGGRGGGGGGSGEEHTFYYEMGDCQEKCKIELVKTPRHGHCPKSVMQNVTFQNIIAPFDEQLACIDNCRYDFECPDVQKCCETTCGPVCMSAFLRDDKQLPPIPKILNYKMSRSNKVVIKIQTTTTMISYIHVEIRFHIAKMFSERKIANCPWQWQNVDKIAEVIDHKSNLEIDVSFSLKPGRWYQIRVAAINAYGFRGYGYYPEDNTALTLTTHPKPPKAPADMKVVSSRLINDKCYVKIVWCPSKSNLPIEKYKVVWSHRIQSKHQSYIYNEAFVKEAVQYEIAKLLADSTYQIQIQAISINGKRRLKSEKFSLVYNTTTASYAVPMQPLKCTRNRYVNDAPFLSQYERNSGHTNAWDGNKVSAILPNTTLLDGNVTNPSYAVRFRMNRRLGMIVQITGFHPQKDRVYELFPKDINSGQEYRTIRAKKNSLEFIRLNYNTTYVLKAFASNNNNSYSSAAPYNFTTPRCETFRGRFPKMQIKC